MTFDPDLAPGYPRRLLKGVQLPPVKPSAPMGRFSSRLLARAALLSALKKEGDWWSEPLLSRWASGRGLTLAQARELVSELVTGEHVEEGWSATCARWRAKGGE